MFCLLALVLGLTDFKCVPGAYRQVGRRFVVVGA